MLEIFDSLFGAFSQLIDFVLGFGWAIFLCLGIVIMLILTLAPTRIQETFWDKCCSFVVGVLMGSVSGYFMYILKGRALGIILVIVLFYLIFYKISRKLVKIDIKTERLKRKQRVIELKEKRHA